MRDALYALILAGCASRVISPDGAVADAPSAEVLLVDRPAQDVAAVRCGAGDMAFPPFDARCDADDDCTLGVHQTDCCGNTVALGMRTAERARFASAEALCRPMYPGCGCPSSGTLADDGMRSFDVGGLRVACREGRCAASVGATPSCPGVTCGPGQLCARGCCGVPGCTPPPGRCVTVPPACGGRPGCGCLGSGACPTGSCVGVEGADVVCRCA